MPVSDLPDVLTVQTLVNGEERQKATTSDLIFSIPTLIGAVSQGITVQPGDVIATGTVCYLPLLRAFCLKLSNAMNSQQEWALGRSRQYFSSLETKLLWPCPGWAS